MYLCLFLCFKDLPLYICIWRGLLVVTLEYLKYRHNNAKIEEEGATSFPVFTKTIFACLLKVVYF